MARISRMEFARIVQSAYWWAEIGTRRSDGSLYVSTSHLNNKPWVTCSAVMTGSSPQPVCQVKDWSYESLLNVLMYCSTFRPHGMPGETY